MRTWKKQNPDSYCHLQFDKLYIDNRLYVWDKESGEVRLSDSYRVGGRPYSPSGCRTRGRPRVKKDKHRFSPSLQSFQVGFKILGWRNFLYHLLLTFEKNINSYSGRADQAQAWPDSPILGPAPQPWPGWTLSGSPPSQSSGSGNLTRLNLTHTQAAWLKRHNVSGLRRMQVFRDHAAFVCQGEFYFRTKRQENTMTTSAISHPPFLYWYVWNSFGSRKIEFLVQDLRWSLACPTGPRLTTHATGGARG